MCACAACHACHASAEEGYGQAQATLTSSPTSAARAGTRPRHLKTCAGSERATRGMAAVRTARRLRIGSADTRWPARCGLSCSEATAGQPGGKIRGLVCCAGRRLRRREGCRGSGCPLQLAQGNLARPRLRRARRPPRRAVPDRRVPRRSGPRWSISAG